MRNKMNKVTIKTRQSLTQEEKSKLVLKYNEFVKSLEIVSPDLTQLRQVTDRMYQQVYNLEIKVEPNLSRLLRMRTENPDTTIEELSKEYSKIDHFGLEESSIRNYFHLFCDFDDRNPKRVVKCPNRDILKNSPNLTVDQEFKNKVKYFRECLDDLCKMKDSLSSLLEQVNSDFEKFEEKHL